MKAKKYNFVGDGKINPTHDLTPRVIKLKEICPVDLFRRFMKEGIKGFVH